MKLNYQLLALLIMVCSPVIAAADNILDGFGVELGRGNDSTKEARIHAKWNWDKKWLTNGTWYLTGYWEASLGGWQDGGNGGKNLWDIGITPVFRLQPRGSESGFYLEGAVGAHLLSGKSINDHRNFGSHFSFGDHVGFGATFGDKGEYDLGYRLQHMSNAKIKEPNNGINFNQIRFTYNY